MAEFQEEQLFRGASQGQGFAPIQAPDITPFLRENMGIVDRNYERMVSAKKAEQESQLTKAQELYKTLGQFSEKAMEIAKTMGSAYIDSQIIEGKTKMRSYGKASNYGVSPQGQAEYDSTKASIQDQSTLANETALKAHEQGAPIEAVNYIKSLPGYQQIGATEYYLKRKGDDYKTSLEQFLQSQDVQLPLPDGSGTFTPDQIDDDPIKAQIALSAFGRMYLADQVGIGREFNPNNAMMRALYEGMDEADTQYISKVRRNKSLNDSEAIVASAEQEFYTTKDIGRFISNITGTYDPKTGAIRNRTEARVYFYERLVDLYSGGDKTAAELLDQPVPWDPKGRSFRQYYKSDIEGENGIDSRLDAIDRREKALAAEQESEELRQRRLNFEAAAKARANNPFTEKEIDEMLKDAMNDTGKTEDYFPWFKNYQTIEKQDAKLEEEALDDIRRRRGYLIESDLRTVSSATYQKYISLVQDDKSKATIPKSFESDANKLITALTDEHFKVEQGDAPKTPEWEDMARRARGKYGQYVMQGITEGMTQGQAQEAAIKRLKENFAAGTYTKDVDATPDVRYLKKVRSARYTMSQKPQLDQYVFGNTEAELQALVKYNNGQGAIPKFYYDLAQGQKNLTAWDIAAAQFRAAGYGELGANAKRRAYNKLDPALQSVLNYKPTPRRVRRATTQSFNTQTSTLSNPTLKRAADIVSNYESAGSGGYDAVNQGGEDGGTAIPAGFYSGPFSKMSQHGGKKLVDMTVGEIMSLQADPGKSKLSNTDWVKQGKLHAVGRYQFIGSTLKVLVQRLGIPSTAKFTPALQDQLFLSLLKSGGLGQWVGPTKYATAEEKAIINQARTQL